MKVVMFWELYPALLDHFYKKYPQAKNLSFVEQQSLFFGECYSWQTSLCVYMNTIGIETHFILANAEAMQKQWAYENGFIYPENQWKSAIVVQQIKNYKADVLWISALFGYYGTFILEMRQYVKKVITWVGSPFVEKVDVRGIDVLLTENDQTLKSSHYLFKKVIVTQPGFDISIIDKIQPIKKKHTLSFIGSLSPAHSVRLSIINNILALGMDLKLFAYMQYPLPLSSILLGRLLVGNFLVGNFPEAKKNYQRYKVAKKVPREMKLILDQNNGPLFGLDMYKELASSYATLNIHIDCASNNSGNMRLFEATGVGTCVVTEQTKNIDSLFDPMKEVVTYKDRGELMEKLKWLSKNLDSAAEIGENAQKRILKNHTIENMFDVIKSVF